VSAQAWAARVPVRGLWAAVLLVAGVVLHREGADFPWTYHNDEPSKVRQILEGWRNYRHPPLMLDAVALAEAVVPGRQEPQEVAEWGRAASAGYGAAAVVLMADAAWMAAGPWAGLATGAVLLLHGPSYEMAHYFKEDSLFLLGLALMLHALAGWRRHGGAGWALGWLAAGWVLVGAKWIGWIPWLLSLPSAWPGLRGLPRRRLALLAAVFAGVVLAAGIRYWTHWEVFALTGREEWEALWQGDYAAGVEVPHGRYLELLGTFWPLEWLGLAAGCALFARWRGGLPGGAWCLWNVGAALAALAWTAKFSERYAVPVAWLLAWLACVGPPLLAARLRLPRAGLVQAALALLGALVLSAGQWPDFQARREGFATDSRELLSAWLARQDTSDWRLARDQPALIQLPPARVEEESFFAADLGTVDDLRRRGITHVAVSYEVFHRYVDGSADQSLRADPLFARRAEFYQTLLRGGKVACAMPNRHPKTLHPGITLVDIR